MSKSLDSTTIKQLAERSKLPVKDNMLVLESSFSVVQALDSLAKRKVRSAPVVFDGTVQGLFDVRDLLSAMLESFSKAKKPEEIAWSEFEHDLLNLTVRGVSFATKRVGEVANASRNDPFGTCYENGTLAQVLEEMLAKKLHRIVVLSEDKHFLKSIVSLSDLILFLAEHSHEWSSTTGAIPVSAIVDLSVSPISMSNTASAIQGFLLMHVHRVSGIAVVDSNGVLEANLSASDLRDVSYTNAFVPTTFRDLFLPLRSYLLKKSKEGNTIHAAPLIVSLDTTLETALLQMAMFRVHRLYIVDKDKKPIGVVTAFDVLRQFLPKK